MVEKTFERQAYGTVELDLCFSCQGIWFDEFESAQITPGGIIALFELLHAHQDDQRIPLGDPLKCPRCDERLLQGFDIAKFGGQFNYHRCLQKHGRFTTFAQFMIEKGFVRQLNPAEIEALSAKVGIIRCMGCGAPVDIRKDHACGHCRAPISILDPTAIDQALNRFQQAEVRRSSCDVEALGDAIVMRERELSRQKRLKQEPDNAGIIDAIDLASAGVEFVWHLFRR
jgi:hypothetical protein